MKKIIAVILALVFVLSLFAGCNKTPEDTQLSPENPPKSEEKGDNEDNKNETPDKNKEDNEVPDDNTNETNGTEVTGENVKELFLPSLEAYFCYQGSSLYELEKDDNGNPKSYDCMEMEKYFEYVGLMDCYKIAENITYEEIKERFDYYTAVSMKYFELDENCFAEINGDLYLGVASFSREGVFDINSIKLYKRERDKYFVSVDHYAWDDYEQSYIFITTLKDDILYIEEIGEPIQRDDINPENKRKFISMLSKLS